MGITGRQSLLASTALTPVRWALDAARWIGRHWKGTAVGFGLLVTGIGAILAFPTWDDLSRYDHFITKQELTSEALIRRSADWREAYADTILLHLAVDRTTQKITSQQDTDFIPVVDKDGPEHRSFAIIADPSAPGKVRLFECFYRTHDHNDRDNSNPTSTDFNMTGFVEHDFGGTREGAAEIIDRLKEDPNGQRVLIKEANRPKVRICIGGYTFDPGGDANARHIEFGGLPLQAKNLLGLDGKRDALEECAAAARKVGVCFDWDPNLPPAKLEVASTSMGGPTAMMAISILKETHPALVQQVNGPFEVFSNTSIDWNNFVPMGIGQTARQMTEFLWNKRFNQGGEYKHIDEIEKLGEEARKQAVEILKEVFNYGHTNSYFDKANQMTYYYVGDRGEGGVPNDTIWNTPCLPGMQAYVLEFDPVSWPINPNSYIGHGLQMYFDHFASFIAALLEKGPQQISPAFYDPFVDLVPSGSLEEKLDKMLFAPPVTERTLGNKCAAGALHFLAHVMNPVPADSREREPVSRIDVAAAINFLQPGPIGKATHQQAGRDESGIERKK